MAVLKAMTSGGKRRELDFYPTPKEATLALLPLIEHWPKYVWEPCCGDGAISKVLQGAGYPATSSDIADRGFGITPVDFFEESLEGWWPTIITNPPYGQAAAFIRHAHEIGVERMALLLKANFWNAAIRLPVWNLWRPYLIAPLTWRLDFTGAGAPHTDCMWCLWDRAVIPGVEFRPLRKPS